MPVNFTILRQRAALERSQPLIISSPRGMRSHDSGWPLDTRNNKGTSGNVFASLPARERPSSALFENSRNLASSSCGLGPSTWNMEEGWDKSRRVRQYQLHVKNQGVAKLNPFNHTGGTYSHNGMMDYHKVSDQCILEHSLTHWNFKARKSTSRLKFKISSSSHHYALDQRS